MDRMIYLSMAGAKATMQRQDALAHNLANASTPGFRAEMTAFRAVPVRGDGASTRVYALESTPGYDSAQGTVQQTGRNLDVAMTGNSWLKRPGRLPCWNSARRATRSGSTGRDSRRWPTPAGNDSPDSRSCGDVGMRSTRSSAN